MCIFTKSGLFVHFLLKFEFLFVDFNEAVCFLFQQEIFLLAQVGRVYYNVVS